VKLHKAVNDDLKVGALIHQKTGVARRVEILAVEDSRLLAVSRVGEEEAKFFGPNAAVRLELPKESSVVCIPGRVTQSRQVDGVLELEISCPEGAEERQRRMDARVAVECRVRIRSDETWQTRTVNVSAGGALLANGGSLHAGQVVEVELDLDGETIGCQAEVVRRGVKTIGDSL